MPKILFIAYKYEYGRKDFGLSYEYHNFYTNLLKANNGSNQVIYFPVDEIVEDYGYEGLNKKLIETVETERPDICFFVILENFFDKQTIREISKKDYTTTFVFFTDDHWAFYNFSKYWADCFNWVSTTDIKALPKYKKIGYKNVIKTQWGYDNYVYKPLDLPKIYDVTFIGEPHGYRKEIARKLFKAGIKLECFGKGWPNGRVSREKMAEIISQSKINLNFARSSIKINPQSIIKIFVRKRIDGSIKINHPRMWFDNVRSIFAGKEKQIKIRNFEIPGCKGFLLTDYVEGLEEYFEIGKEIVCYKDINDLINKIKYYLDHQEEREAIAQGGYNRTIHDHTYEKRFNEIFETIGSKNE